MNRHSPSETFNETVEELTQSLMPLVAQNGMDWMFANCSTTAQCPSALKEFVNEVLGPDDAIVYFQYSKKKTAKQNLWLLVLN